jgi:hypothetical protein
LNEISTEKIVALHDRARNKPRDIGPITDKLRFRKKDIPGVEDRIFAKDARLMALWNGRLGHQIEH